jgi:hypothetical protein
VTAMAGIKNYNVFFYPTAKNNTLQSKMQAITIERFLRFIHTIDIVIAIIIVVFVVYIFFKKEENTVDKQEKT